MKKGLCTIVCLLCALALLASCAAPSGGKKLKTPITLIDQAGNEVKIEKEIGRIASGYYISSSALIAMGLKDKIVGIEDKSEKRPIYKLAADGISDRCVNIGSAKQFDLEGCISSKPDLVILPKKAADYAPALKELGIPVLIVNPEDADKLSAMISLLATATGSEERANALLAKQNEIITRVTAAADKLADSEKPVVYMCSPSSYLTTCPKDMYQASLIRQAGGFNAGDVLKGDSRTEISYEQLIAMNPDVIIVPTNDFASAGPDYTVEDILNDRELKDVTAVKNGAVYQMPYGLEAWDSPVPSGCLGAAWLLSVLHPDLISLSEVADMAEDFYSELYGFKADTSIITG